MSIIRSVRGKTPAIEKDVFLAETAVVIGDTSIGAGTSVWNGAVLRGDVNRIEIGERCNIQDGVVIHVTFDGAPHPSQTHIGNDVSVGHGAIIHGATIEDNCLIGMRATVLDNAVVKRGCIVAAGAVVTAGSVLEEGGLYAGIPAKRIKDVTAEQRKYIIDRTARDYQLYASWYE